MRQWLNQVLIHVAATIFDSGKLEKHGEGIEHTSTFRLNVSIKFVGAFQFIIDSHCCESIPEQQILGARIEQFKMSQTTHENRHWVDWAVFGLDALHWGIKHALKQHWVTGLMHQTMPWVAILANNLQILAGPLHFYFTRSPLASEGTNVAIGNRQLLFCLHTLNILLVVYALISQTHVL